MDKTNGGKDDTREEPTGYLKELWQDIRKESKRIMFFVEIGALLGLGFYVCETKRTNNLTQQALEDGREHFIKDQRPYIWRSSARPLPFSPGQRIQVNLYLVNYGKSPALRSFGEGKVFFGEHALDDADKWFTSRGTKTLEVHGGSVVVIPPVVPADPEKTPAFTTLLSDSIPTAEEYIYILQHDFAIVVVSREQYEDTSGNIYQSDMCFFRFLNGAMGQCEKHNEIR